MICLLIVPNPYLPWKLTSYHLDILGHNPMLAVDVGKIETTSLATV